MKLVKCPICELNYMPADAEMCDVCRNERKKSKKKDAPVIQICPECNENPVVPGEEFCAACLREHKRLEAIEKIALNQQDALDEEEEEALEEALAWCKAHGMAVLLEVKSCELLMHEDMPTLAQRIVEALQKADFFDQCVVFGVNHWILREVCRLDSRCKIALIVPHVPDDPVALMRHMGAIIYLCFIDNLSRPLIDQLHAAGYLVDGSVINSKERMKTALEIGCDMVESDTPDQAIAWYRELTEEAERRA